MKRLRDVFIMVFLICWLTVIGQQGVLSSLDFHSAAGSAQSSAPADNDDHSDDGTLADFSFQNHRIEVVVPLLPSPGRTSGSSWNPPLPRRILSAMSATSGRLRSLAVAAPAKHPQTPANLAPAPADSLTASAKHLTAPARHLAAPGNRPPITLCGQKLGEPHVFPVTADKTHNQRGGGTGLSGTRPVRQAQTM